MSTRTSKRPGEQDPLIQAIVQKLASKDRASLLQRAAALADNLFPSDEASPVQGDDLGQNPGTKAVGAFGVFEARKGSLSFFGVCARYADGKYFDKDGDRYPFFRHIPTTPAILQWLQENDA